MDGCEAVNLHDPMYRIPIHLSKSDRVHLPTRRSDSPLEFSMYLQSTAFSPWIPLLPAVGTRLAASMRAPNPTPGRSLAARARSHNSAWKQIPASPRPPVQKRRPGRTKPPSIGLVSTDSRPVGTQPTAGPLNPHGTTRSYSPLPRRCAEAPRPRQPPHRAAATRHPLRDHSRKHPGGCPRCC